MNLSIIIPMLNEATQLPELFAHLLPYQRAGCEIVFADGGSTDGSPELARIAGYQVVTSARGRALQMNAGVGCGERRAAVVPACRYAFAAGGRRTISHRRCAVTSIAGAGSMCASRGRPFMLRVIARMMNWRSCLTGIATGDQAMFMRRDVFQNLQGFPEQPLMEDIELSKRLKQLTRPACIHHCVTTSGRRWETRGVWPTIFLMWRLRWAYWRGADANELAGLYR